MSLGFLGVYTRVLMRALVLQGFVGDFGELGVRVFQGVEGVCGGRA